MKYLFLSVILLATTRFCQGGPLRLHKRAAFYIANETACVVDSTVYSNGDPIPTDDPCEACKCRPPGFACVLKECEVKPGCRAVRRAGHCCPEYICETNTSGVDTTSFAIKTDSDIEVTTISDISPETTQQYENQTEHASLEVSHDEAIREEASSEPSVEPENPDPIHFIADTIREEYASETQDRGSSSDSQTPEEKDATTQPIQNDDSDEIQEDGTNKTGEKSDLLNTDSEINEHVEEQEKTGDGSSSESTTADSDISVSSETISKANVEIFADETTEGHKFEATTTTQDLPSSDPKTTEAPATKDMIEIETNAIEKRFRSLANATSEDTKSGITEYEKGKPTHTEVPEIASTGAPEEKLSTFQEIGTSTQVPETDSSVVLETKDTTISDQTTNADKSLYYKAEEKILEALGTVTAVVNVHEDTSSSENDGVKTPTSIPSNSKENLSTQTNIPKETISYENVDKAFSEIPY